MRPNRVGRGNQVKQCIQVLDSQVVSLLPRRERDFNQRLNNITQGKIGFETLGGSTCMRVIG